MNRMIITGGAGFIGSHLVRRWLKGHPGVELMNIDKLGYASNPESLEVAGEHPRYHFEKLDLCDRTRVRDLIRVFEPDGVIHLAAESHVDNSILDPEPFVMSNILGTFNLLEECRQYWKKVGRLEKARFHHVSTDEVYGTLANGDSFTETSPYQPNSPYSASKASSDHLVRAYHHTFGMNTVISNSSNNFGPYQHDEKLIPTVIRAALKHEAIPVYGNGENVRDWIFVEDHCRAIESLFAHGEPGDHYNVGARNERRNINLVHQICDLLNTLVADGPNGDYKNLIRFVTDRPGHDWRYSIDPSKIQRELRWSPAYRFEEALQQTVQWYAERYR